MIYILIWLQATLAGAVTPGFFRHGSATCAALLESLALDTADGVEDGVAHVLPLRLMKGETEDLFLLSRRIWDDVADRERLKELARRFAEGDADAAAELHERRSRLKNLRFAFTLFDREHGEGDALNEMVKAMGLLRDARHNQNARWLKKGVRDFEHALTRERWEALTEELDAFHPTRPEIFYAYQLAEVERLRELASHARATGKTFHEMRKIVARFAALYGLLRARCPSERIEATFRHLSSLNGRMSARHDQIVAAAARDELDYARDPLTTPASIRDAIARLRP